MPIELHYDDIIEKMPTNNMKNAHFLAQKIANEKNTIVKICEYTKKSHKCQNMKIIRSVNDPIKIQQTIQRKKYKELEKKQLEQQLKQAIENDDIQTEELIYKL